MQSRTRQHAHTAVCVCLRARACVCVCVCERERGGGGGHAATLDVGPWGRAVHKGRGPRFSLAEKHNRGSSKSRCTWGRDSSMNSRRRYLTAAPTSALESRPASNSALTTSTASCRVNSKGSSWARAVPQHSCQPAAEPRANSLADFHAKAGVTTARGGRRPQLVFPLPGFQRPWEQRGWRMSHLAGGSRRLAWSPRHRGCH